MTKSPNDYFLTHVTGCLKQLNLTPDVIFVYLELNNDTRENQSFTVKYLSKLVSFNAAYFQWINVDGGKRQLPRPCRPKAGDDCHTGFESRSWFKINDKNEMKRLTPSSNWFIILTKIWKRDEKMSNTSNLLKRAAAGEMRTGASAKMVFD